MSDVRLGVRARHVCVPRGPRSPHPHPLATEATLKQVAALLIPLATEATLKQVATSLIPVGSVQLGHETNVTNAGAIQLLAANPQRRGVIIQNNGTASVRIGPPGVGLTTGIRLLPNAIFTGSPPFLPVDEINAISEGADSAVFATEVL